MSAPTEIGEYQIVRQLGQGGMGEVYLAHDRALDRLVAIKLIGHVRAHADARARFAREAKAVARLKHPNVVTVHRTGEHHGRAYLVSEYVEGTPLDKLEHPVPYDRALAIARDLARGLAAAHAQGVLHRDVKPANAILGVDGSVKLLDFGLAKLGGDGATPVDATPAREALSAPPVDATPGSETLPATPVDIPPARAAPGALSTITFDGAPPASAAAAIGLTVVGARLGTPRYMAPEAWRGERLTAASDVYSLGVVLWELFAARHPFASDDGSVVLDGDPGGEPPSIATVAPALPAALAAVVDRSVRRAASERYPDACALRDALEAALEAAPTPAPVAEARPPASRPLRLLVVGGALALGGGAALFAATRGGGGDDTRAPTPAPPAAVTVPAPTPLTRLGGCAETPAFLDAATIAFGFAKDDILDVMTTTGDGAARPLVDGPAMDYAPLRGRHLGEVLHLRMTDEGGTELRAFDRATHVQRALVPAAAAATIGETIYVIEANAAGRISKLGAAGALEPVATTPPGKTPIRLAGAPASPRLVVVVGDRDSPPGLCVVELASGAVRCPETERLINGAPAVTNDGRFAFYAARAGIRRLDLAGDTGDVLVVPGGRANGGLALSPDQTRLVFSDCRSYGSIVAVGDGATEMLVEAGLVKHPIGGPNGLLAWIGARDGGGTKLLVREPGQAPRELAAVATELGRAAFDPAGAQLAYSDGGPGGGVRTVAVAGGAPVAWTSEPRDRGPVWLPGGGLAFTRLDSGGAPSVLAIASPGAPPRPLLAGWGVEDVEPASGSLLVTNQRALALLDLATRELTTLALGDAAKHGILGARVAPDGTWFVVLGGPAGGTFYRVDRAGAVRIVHQVPSSQTAGPPSFLSDGRITFRPEIWLGEMYQLTGAWAAP